VDLLPILDDDDRGSRYASHAELFFKVAVDCLESFGVGPLPQ
jgi:hypothetical protein